MAWTVQEMVAHINLVTDESFSQPQVVSFINDGISQVNVYAESVFPMITDSMVEYTAIPEHWQRQLFVSYAAARIKQNDSSQFEYSDWFSQFQANMVEFEAKFTVPDEFKDPSVKVKTYEPNFDNSPWDWRGW